jgi:hypothetical protein
MRDGDFGRTSDGGPHRCPESRAFLTGPDGRVTELRHAVGILRELVRGYRTLHFVGPCVTVLGSLRRDDDATCQLARAVGGAMARAGLTVMTGGGGGIAEAASRGAREAGGRTVGCTVESSPPQAASLYLDRELRLRYAFVRKALLVKYSVALVALPGGLGTLDEVFDVLTLSTRGDLRDFPIVLMGERHWRPLLDQIDAWVAREAPLDAVDRRSIVITDSPDEATRSVLRAAAHRFGIKLQPRRARRILGEHSLGGHSSRPRRYRFGRPVWPRPPERTP